MSGWQARLELQFARRGPQTYLAHKHHVGPLLVQKPLYPEGPEMCHCIIIHPPAGIAGGDQLTLQATVAENAAAFLTTPGATKWYRSIAGQAKQQVHLQVAAGASLEWLPQEAIYFRACDAHNQVQVDLTGDAAFIGWEITCLGRTASGEHFDQGLLRSDWQLHRDGQPIWLERGRVAGGAPILQSRAGFAGQPVCGTLVVSAPGLGQLDLAALREIAVGSGEVAITRLPDVLLARYLGPSSEAARSWMLQLWQVLREPITGRTAQVPRIWRT